MDVRKITLQNPWWESKDRIYEDEKVRQAEARENRIEYSFPEENLLIFGPRQVGKTTFLKLFAKYLIEKGVDSRRVVYFSFDTARHFEEIIEVVEFCDSLIEGKKYFLFDEITFVEEWQRAVKFLLDSPLGRGKTFYITGSSSINIKKETFPGRPIKSWRFLPLSFYEFCRVFGSKNLKNVLKPGKEAIDIQRAKEYLYHFPEVDRLFRAYIYCGGFPRSMYEHMEEGKIRDETYEIYWKWLIADIAKLRRSERVTTSVLQGVLKNQGTRFSLNSIAKEMEIGSHVTVREYLEVLEDLFVLRSIFPVNPGRNVGKYRGMRKAYFIDPFLYWAFKRVITQRGFEEEDIAGVVEGIVGEHLIRRFGQVFYFYKKKEVDFYFDGTGVEVKWQKRVDRRDFPRVDVERKILLTVDTFKSEDDLLIIPVSVFLLTLG